MLKTFAGIYRQLCLVLMFTSILLNCFVVVMTITNYVWDYTVSFNDGSQFVEFMDSVTAFTIVFSVFVLLVFSLEALILAIWRRSINHQQILLMLVAALAPAIAISVTLALKEMIGGLPQ